MSRHAKLLIGVTGLAVLAFAAITFAVIMANGPADFGLRCSRAASGRSCEVRQTRFMGLALNSSFAIPESRISGARAICAAASVGGRARNPNCTVYLLLNSGAYRAYPVLSYPDFDAAQVSAQRIRSYLDDPSASAIDLRDDIPSELLLFLGIPLLIIALALMLRKMKHRSGS